MSCVLISFNCTGLEKNISIESSADSPIAGERFVITCTVISDRPAQLTWIGRNGLPISEKNPSVSSQVTSGMLTSVKLIFQPLYTSHTGIYTCASLVGSNINSKTYSVRVQSKFACKRIIITWRCMCLLCAVPPPRITIKHDPTQETHYTGSSLTLTCTVQVDPAVDTPVIVNNQWIGHSYIFDDGGRVIISQFEKKHPFYKSVVKFRSLKTKDAGNYTCLANVSSLNESLLLLSSSSQAEYTLTLGNLMKHIIIVNWV